MPGTDSIDKAIDGELSQEHRILVNDYIEERLSRLFKTLGISSVASLLFGIAYLFFYVPKFAASDIENIVTSKILTAGSLVDTMRMDLAKNIGNTEKTAADIESKLSIMESDLNELSKELKNTTSDSKVRLSTIVEETNDNVDHLVIAAEKKFEAAINSARDRIRAATLEVDEAILLNKRRTSELKSYIDDIERKIDEQNTLLASVTNDEITRMAGLVEDLKGFGEGRDILDGLASFEASKSSFATASDIKEVLQNVHKQFGYILIFRKNLGVNTISQLDRKIACVSNEVNAQSIAKDIAEKYSIAFIFAPANPQYGSIPQYKASHCEIYIDYAIKSAELMNKINQSGKHTSMKISL